MNPLKYIREKIQLALAAKNGTHQTPKRRTSKYKFGTHNCADVPRSLQHRFKRFEDKKGNETFVCACGRNLPGRNLKGN